MVMRRVFLHTSANGKVWSERDIREYNQIAGPILIICPNRDRESALAPWNRVLPGKTSNSMRGVLLLFGRNDIPTRTRLRNLPSSRTKPKKKSAFDAQVFLESVGVSRKVADFRKDQTIFSQGDAANSVIYIQTGSVKLTVVNESGKEAVVAIFGAGDFFGEGGMAGRRSAWVRRVQFCRRPCS